MDSHPWVVLSFRQENPGAIECLRGGRDYRVSYPVPLAVLTAIGKAFAREHAHCAPKAGVP